MIGVQVNRSEILDQLVVVSHEVGNTPIQQLNSLFRKTGVRIFVKKEWEQLSGSVKIRAAYAIIKNAVETGKLDSDKILLDATSGNTGIAYASIGARTRIKVALCLPENASPERKKILKDLGAELIYTSRFEGTDGAQLAAKELVAAFPNKYFYADQYANENNWKAHYQTTAAEIIKDLPEITHFVTGLGTTGTFVGTGRKLKELKPGIHLTALQPDSPMHGLEGWKHLETAIIPGIYDAALPEQLLEINTDEAYELIRSAVRLEGLRLSPSSAANIAGAIKVAQKLDSGTVLTMLPDNADKYKDVLDSLME